MSEISRQYAFELAGGVGDVDAAAIYRQQFAVFATREDAIVAGWPDAEYGTWQRSPSSVECVDGWIALDSTP